MISKLFTVLQSPITPIILLIILFGSTQTEPAPLPAPMETAVRTESHTPNQTDRPTIKSTNTAVLAETLTYIPTNAPPMSNDLFVATSLLGQNMRGWETAVI